MQDEDKNKIEENLEEDATIALFGAHSAGKTTFIQAICAQSKIPKLRSNPENNIIIYPVNGATQAYLADLNESYIKGHFPSPNKEEKELLFNIIEEGTRSKQIIFKVMDPPGEWLEPSAFKDSRYKTVQDFVKNVDCIYFFIEPSSFLDLPLMYVQKFLENYPRWWDDRFIREWNEMSQAITTKTTNGEKLNYFLANFKINPQLLSENGDISQAIQAILNSQQGDDEKLNLWRGLFMDHLFINDFGDQEINLQTMYWGPDRTSKCQSIPNAPDSIKIKRVNQLCEIADIFTKNQPNAHEQLLVNLLRSNNYTAQQTVENGLVNFTVANRKRQLVGQPISLIVPKCDQIPGFNEDSSPVTQLIPKELDDLRYVLKFDEFKEKLCDYWRGKLGSDTLINNLLSTYSGMISLLLNHQMDFQIFFVTGVGKVVFDVQAARYRPPLTGPKPRGVREPLAWFTQRYRRGAWAKRRIQILFRWGVAGIVFMALPVYLHVYSKKLDGVLIGSSVDETVLMSLSGWPMLGTGDLKEIMALVRKHQSMVSRVKGFRDSLTCQGTPNEIRPLLDNADKILNEFKRYSQELPVCRNRRIVEFGQMIAQLERTITTLNSWNRDGIKFRFPNTFDIGQNRRLQIILTDKNGILASDKISLGQDLTWKPGMFLTIKVDPDNIGGLYSRSDSIPNIDLLDPSKSIMLTVVQSQTNITENIPLSLAFLHDSFCHTLQEAMPPIPTY